MKIRKAIITAAGQSQRSLPLQRLVDRDGNSKTALQIILEEAGTAGCEEICLVVCPGDEDSFRTAAGPRAAQLQFVTQPEPRGYGHALHCARAFAGDEPFLHLVSDHLYVSTGPQRCAQQLVAVASAENCAVSAVHATRETMLPYYGTVGGRRVPQRPNLYEITTVAEKPTPTEAEQTLIVPGLRAGHYLCFFGMHILTPALLGILADEVAQPANRNIQLSPALAKLADRERYLAHEVAGQRYNIGVKYGLLTAQLALALAGNDRAEVLTQLVELVATQPKP
ncbi:MAG: UTP--glucose-1-phosphate uridylyltransferase [Verrucomicrobiae bacterium]|nr:UTP--glucose-1-phosphate uridylyltransferase [Verrucomicrobiae bacterium]